MGLPAAPAYFPVAGSSSQAAYPFGPSATAAAINPAYSLYNQAAYSLVPPATAASLSPAYGLSSQAAGPSTLAAQIPCQLVLPAATAAAAAGQAPHQPSQPEQRLLMLSEFQAPTTRGAEPANAASSSAAEFLHRHLLPQPALPIPRDGNLLPAMAGNAVPANAASAQQLNFCVAICPVSQHSAFPGVEICCLQRLGMEYQPSQLRPLKFSISMQQLPQEPLQMFRTTWLLMDGWTPTPHVPPLEGCRAPGATGRFGNQMMMVRPSAHVPVPINMQGL